MADLIRSARQVRVLLLDYGGVVADHYSQPYLDRLASLLGVDPRRALELVSEKSPHGEQFRLNLIDLSAFCQAIGRLSGVPTTDPTAVLRSWAQTYVPNEAMLSLITHLREARGLCVGLLMNEDRDRLNYLREIGMDRHFDFIVASCDIGITKPNPGIYHYALHANGVTTDPGEILYVDDRSSHIASAEALGFQVKLFTTPGEFSLFITERVFG